MKNIDRFVSNVSQCILQQDNVLILILNGTKICMITQFLLKVIKVPTGWSWEKFQWFFKDISRKKFPNFHKNSEHHKTERYNEQLLLPKYSHTLQPALGVSWKLIVFLPDLFNSLSIVEAEWCIYASVRKNIIGSDHGSSPDRCQAIIWTNAWILLIGSEGTTFSEILIEIHIFSYKKMHLQMSPGKWRPFCLGLNEFIMYKKNILPKCFPDPGERRTTPPTGGQHCINLHPDHHRMFCWAKPACRMWQGTWDLRYEWHAESLLQKKENQ